MATSCTGPCGAQGVAAGAAAAIAAAHQAEANRVAPGRMGRADDRRIRFHVAVPTTN